jgi:hypothetical protein
VYAHYQQGVLRGFHRCSAPRHPRCSGATALVSAKAYWARGKANENNGEPAKA